ncbi:hypothetical protein SO694_00081031 [Aureococcus anophagefferens]|uniref:Uncharacterized protein n=1 Tax=Aureococcus anophagefferens TaxID=44056 RepID=A0ABR1G553_AURAN
MAFRAAAGRPATLTVARPRPSTPRSSRPRSAARAPALVAADARFGTVRGLFWDLAAAAAAGDGAGAGDGDVARAALGGLDAPLSIVLHSVQKRSLADLGAIGAGGAGGGSLRTWSYKSPLVNQVQVVLSAEGRPARRRPRALSSGGPDNTPCKMRVYVENGQLRPFSCVIATPRGPNTVAIRNIGQMEFPIAAGVIELYTEDGLDRPFFAILETPGSGNVVRIVNTAPVEFPMTAPSSASIDDKMASGAFDGDVVIGGDIGW